MPEEVSEALDLASEFWNASADAARVDADVLAATQEVVAAEERLRKTMRAARMDRICSACGEETGGGCCGASVARQADPLLLFANRLLGSPACPQNDDFTTCCFLGKNGCVLRVKPLLCVHYDCAVMLASVAPKRLAAVDEARNALLEAWIALEVRLRQLLELP